MILLLELTPIQLSFLSNSIYDSVGTVVEKKGKGKEKVNNKKETTKNNKIEKSLYETGRDREDL